MLRGSIIWRSFYLGKNEVSKVESRWGGKVILHVDMDAFFAALEQRDNPGLRGRPVIVGGRPGSRGVVSTCSYEARRYGVHAGMSSAEAFRRCPHGHFVHSSLGKYTHASLRLMALLRDYSPRVEPFSIDEAFVDITDCLLPWGTPETLARHLQGRIARELGVTASLGIAPTRLVAKIASKKNKPNGLTVVPPARMREFLQPLPVESIMGVGPKTLQDLQLAGIRTIGNLLEAPSEKLAALPGFQEEGLRRQLLEARYSQVRDIDVKHQAKSMSHEETFARDRTSLQELEMELLYLTEKLARRLRSHELAGRVVSVRLRTGDFQTFQHQRILGDSTNDENLIYTAARRLLSEIFRPGEGYRLVGVRLAQLGKAEAAGQELPFADRETRFRKVWRSVDEIIAQWGNHVLHRASVLPHHGGRERLRPSFRPPEER